jgi:hypothetical protein
MATIKSFTDLSQSKTLSKILSLESADMIWANDNDVIVVPYDMVIRENVLHDFIPCWSLAALLQVLPLGIYDEMDGCDYELEIHMIDKMPRYVRLGDTFHSQFPYDFEKDNLLDNTVESIIWLNDHNYFEL